MHENTAQYMQWKFQIGSESFKYKCSCRPLLNSKVTTFGWDQVAPSVTEHQQWAKTKPIFMGARPLAPWIVECSPKRSNIATMNERAINMEGVVGEHKWRGKYFKISSLLTRDFTETYQFIKSITETSTIMYLDPCFPTTMAAEEWIISW